MSVSRGAPFALESGTGRWDAVLARFEQSHRTRLNVAIHLLTTPLGIFALLGLLAALHPVVPVIGVEVLVLSLRRRLPARLWWINAIAFLGLLVAAVTSALSVSLLLALLGLAWVGQDLAHRLTDESAYSDHYRGLRSAYVLWAEHCLLLLPLVLAVVPRARGSLLGWIVPRSTVRKMRLESPHVRDALSRLEAWVRTHDVPLDRTTHWWQHEVDDEEGARTALARVVALPEIEALLRRHRGRNAVVIPVPGMNEVYVTGPGEDLSSDRVFYRTHVDGPWAVFPGAVLHRCMVGLSANERIRTVFPMERSGFEVLSEVVDRGDVLAFDYHRTPHRIERCEPPPSDEREGPSSAELPGGAGDLRINLKLHYVVAPGWLAPWARLLARLSTLYNARARRLFLDTLRPGSWRDRVKARAVVAWTVVWDALTRFVGHRNLLHVGVLGAASALAGSLLPLVLGGSFVHYLLYVGTFASRRDVCFGVFLRDAVFHKTLSMAILGGLYGAYFEPDPLSLGLVVLGFGTSALAAARLGTERTVFGQELGVCPRRLEERFPYSLLPHPMILGSIVGLIGVHLLDPLRQAWPWLVPAHVLFYLLHLAQEVLDVHESPADPQPGEARGAPSPVR